jgi:hypothetical protein
MTLQTTSFFSTQYSQSKARPTFVVATVIEKHTHAVHQLIYTKGCEPSPTIIAYTIAEAYGLRPRCVECTCVRDYRRVVGRCKRPVDPAAWNSR